MLVKPKSGRRCVGAEVGVEGVEEVVAERALSEAEGFKSGRLSSLGTDQDRVKVVLLESRLLMRSRRRRSNSPASALSSFGVVDERRRGSRGES